MVDTKDKTRVVTWAEAATSIEDLGNSINNKTVDTIMLREEDVQEIIVVARIEEDTWVAIANSRIIDHALINQVACQIKCMVV